MDRSRRQVYGGLRWGEKPLSSSSINELFCDDNIEMWLLGLFFTRSLKCSIMSLVMLFIFISASFCAVYLIFRYVARKRLVIVFLRIVSSLYCLTPFSSSINFQSISSFIFRASFPSMLKCFSVCSRAFLMVGQWYIRCLKSYLHAVKNKVDPL